MSSSTFSATTIVRKSDWRVAERAEQRKLAAPLEHVPKQNRAQPQRPQHQSEPTEHLKG